MHAHQTLAVHSLSQASFFGVFAYTLHTHTPIRLVQNSTQYLGGYSREGRALRDVFGYLQSLYPQGCKHQLLLGRTYGGFFEGKGVGGQEDCGPRMGEQKENIQTLELSLDILVYLFILSHTIN